MVRHSAGRNRRADPATVGEPGLPARDRVPPQEVPRRPGGVREGELAVLQLEPRRQPACEVLRLARLASRGTRQEGVERAPEQVLQASQLAGHAGFGRGRGKRWKGPAEVGGEQQAESSEAALLPPGRGSEVVGQGHALREQTLGRVAPQPARVDRVAITVRVDRRCELADGYGFAGGGEQVRHGKPAALDLPHRFGDADRFQQSSGDRPGQLVLGSGGHREAACPCDGLQLGRPQHLRAQPRGQLRLVRRSTHGRGHYHGSGDRWHPMGRSPKDARLTGWSDELGLKL